MFCSSARNTAACSWLIKMIPPLGLEFIERSQKRRNHSPTQRVLALVFGVLKTAEHDGEAGNRNSANILRDQVVELLGVPPVILGISLTCTNNSFRLSLGHGSVTDNERPGCYNNGNGYQDISNNNLPPVFPRLKGDQTGDKKDDSGKPLLRTLINISC